MSSLSIPDVCKSYLEAGRKEEALQPISWDSMENTSTKEEEFTRIAKEIQQWAIEKFNINRENHRDNAKLLLIMSEVYCRIFTQLVRTIYKEDKGIIRKIGKEKQPKVAPIDPRLLMNPKAIENIKQLSLAAKTMMFHELHKTQATTLLYFQRAQESSDKLSLEQISQAATYFGTHLFYLHQIGRPLKDMHHYANEATQFNLLELEPLSQIDNTCTMKLLYLRYSTYRLAVELISQN